jgi:FemAB-related protein (PEP-CTERM system-associated)
MQIRTATDADQPAWDEYVLNHPDGLAYHQFAWKKAVNEAYGFADCYLLAEEQGAIVGVLPLIDFKVPFIGQSLVSLPYCDIGGCLADSEAITAALLKKAVAIGQQKKSRKIEIRQSSAEKEITSSSKVRMILELPASSAALLAGFKAKLRSQVKKPIRDGLTAQLGGLELVPQFYRVFCENMRDLGSPVHSRQWIEAIVRHYGDNARVGLVLTAEGIPAAAGIILLSQKTVSIPWASSLLKFNNYNPNMLLYWNFLSFAADNGYRYFDFGRSTPGEGTYKFKKQWGAEPVPLGWIDLLNSSPVAKNGSGLRAQVEKVWQKLPVSVATMVGSQLRKYIDL